jgi:Ran GTPase-activating protein (RanGAP) involved in mRNA processing and transport
MQQIDCLHLSNKCKGHQYQVVERASIFLEESSGQFIDSNYWYGDYMFDLSADAWEEIGQDITNNTHLEELTLYEGVLNEQKMTSLFRGLTGSNSIKRISLSGDEQIFSVDGVRSMVPFLQNASNLKKLNVSENNIGSEGFNLLMRALSNSPIQELQCNGCGIESIEIDIDHIPQKLTSLSLANNNISADGCRGLGRLLQGVNSTLTFFSINENNIQSEGINSLWSALRNSPIKILSCSGCGIESIQIDNHIPKKLQILNLSDNMFSVEGCRRLAKLLRGTDSKLGSLNLENSNIDDEGVAIFVNALQDNKSLTHFYLIGNESISNKGKAMLLKLVNDISSIKATLESNHTLEFLTVDECTEEGGVEDDSTSTRSSSSKETNGCLVKRYIKAARV